MSEPVTIGLERMIEPRPARSLAGRRFDTVIVDPPAYAKTRSALAAALRAYRDLNYRALQLLPPGGVLVSCSCSYRVSEADLLQTVAQAAIDCGRTLRVIDRRTQPLDGTGGRRAGRQR